MYEIKQNDCFKFFYKFPSFVRNFCLMVCMACILVPVYVMYFHVGDTSFNSMVKVLKGYNSSTFNYLENHKE